MTEKGRPTHSQAFQAKVALAAVKGFRMLAALVQHYANEIASWKNQLLRGAVAVFGQECAVACGGATGVKRRRKPGQDRRTGSGVRILFGALGKAVLLGRKSDD